MLDDLTKNVKLQLYDKVTSPLSGALLLAWSAFNWKIILVLFSDQKASEKIDYINTYISNNQPGLYLYPIAIAVIYITCYPFLARLAYIASRWHHRNLKADQQKIDDDTPMPLNEAQELRRSLRTAESIHEAEISKKIAEVNQLKEKLASLELTNADLQSQTILLPSELSDTKKTVASLEAEIAKQRANMLRLMEFLNIASIKVHKDAATGNYRLFLQTKNLDNNSPSISAAITEKEKTIEDSLTRTILQEGYFNDYAPIIFATNETAYLQLPKIPNDSSGNIYCLGNYLPSNEPFSNIKNSLKGLDTLTRPPSDG